MRLRSIVFLPFLAILLNSCQPYSNDDLQGDWKAISLMEEGDSLAVNLDNIAFQFEEDGRYHFQSTLKYEEAGIFRLDGQFLFSTDTTRNTATEKAVEILQFANDSLVLLMQEKGKDRTMILQKQ